MQREDARGRLARLLYCGYLAVFWQHHKKLPRYLKTTPRSPKDSCQGLEQRPEAGGCVVVAIEGRRGAYGIKKEVRRCA